MITREDIHWIIDCDPGCDDAVALALAASQLPEETKVELLTVAGNVSVELTTWNALRVLAACGKSWRVYRGTNSSLSGEAVPAASVHGRDGLGDVPNNVFGVEPRRPEPESAVRRLVELGSDTRKFVLVCTGPLTNLASALSLMSPEKQRDFWRRCQICVVMGGAFETHGNITASAEFNTHFDPVSTHLVLESWRVVRIGQVDWLRPIHFVPLDITEKVGIPLHAINTHSSVKGCSPASRFLLAALRKYGLFHSRSCIRPRDKNGLVFDIKEFEVRPYLEERVAGKTGLTHLGSFCYLHDPLAMWVALNHRRRGFDRWWSDAQVAMDISPGVGRGRFIRHSMEKLQDGPSRASILGTKVKWLDPKKFGAAKRVEFVSCIKQLLGISQPSRRKSTSRVAKLTSNQRPDARNPRY